MKRITIIVKRKGRNYGYGFTVPDKVDLNKMFNEVFKGYETVKVKIKII